MEQDQEGGEDRERVEGWVDREWEAAAAEWVAPDPGLAPGEGVSARFAALPLHIRQAFPALITNARNAEQR
jgi:hypothetical protein